MRESTIAALMLVLALSLSGCSSQPGTPVANPSPLQEQPTAIAQNIDVASAGNWQASYPKLPATLPATRAAELSLPRALNDLGVVKDTTATVVRLIPYATIPTSGAVTDWSSLAPSGGYLVVVQTPTGVLRAYSMIVSGPHWKLTSFSPLGKGATVASSVMNPDLSLRAVTLAYQGRAVSWLVRRDAKGASSAIPTWFVWDHWDPQLAGKRLRYDEVYPLTGIQGPISPGPGQ